MSYRYTPEEIGMLNQDLAWAEARVAELDSGLRAARAELPSPGPHKVDEVWAVTCIREAIEIIDAVLAKGRKG